MLIYNSPVSGNCYKVRLLLAQLGIGYEVEHVDVVDRSNRKELLGELNPALRVPTVVLDDGRPLAESNAILWYFGDGTEYMPEDAYERAQVLQWMFFEQYSHEPSIAVARFLRAFLKKHDDPRLPELQKRGYAALGVMDRHLSDRAYFVGDALSIADLALFAYTHKADEGGFDIAPYPAVRAWLERVAAAPGVSVMPSP